MKKLILFICFAFSCILLFGQSSSKTVNITTAGTLSSQFSGNEANNIGTLTITGTINARDMAYIRDKLKVLTNLDISAVNISAYTGSDGTYADSIITYPANELPQYSFYNSKTIAYKSTLVSIKLPNSINSIGDMAFYYCYGLTGTFTLPANLTHIGSFALYGCYMINAFSVDAANPRYSSISGVLFNKNQDSLFICPASKSGSYSIPLTVKYIGSSAFEGCTLLTGTLTIPSSVKSIGSYAFCYCTGFTGSLNIPNSVESIEDGAFYGCSGLNGTVTLPSSLTYLGSFCFFECNDLKSYQVSTSNTLYSSYNDCLYSKNQDTLFICPGGKTGTFTIPSSVKVIGTYAFYNCSYLTGNLVIPSTVELIGIYAFYGCTQISGFDVSSQNLTYSSDNGVLYNKSQDTLFICPSSKSGTYTMPNTVKHVGVCAFCYCENLTGYMYIPASVQSMGEYAFYGCTLLSGFDVEANNQAYSSNQGVLFNHNQDSLYIFPVSKTGKYVIPTTVTTICYCAFDACAGLTEVTFPSTLRSIGYFAFENCTGLTSVKLPKTLTEIINGAFYNCSNLTEVSIANPVPPAIDSYTFMLVNKSVCQLVVPIGSLVSYWNTIYWKDFTLAIESYFSDTALPLVISDNVRIFKQNDMLVVEGLSTGETIEIFTLSGKLTKIIKSAGQTENIYVPKGNIYIVKTPEKIAKINL